MNLLNLSKMPFSFHGGWDTVVKSHPVTLKTFFLLVLPLSLLPPVALMYAGTTHPAMFWVSAPYSRWLAVAIAFFITELATVSMMGWAIQKIAQRHNFAVAFQDSYLLAAITAAPLWLSSLSLFSPDIWLVVGIVALGLVIAASVLYHGTFVILKMQDPIEAQSISYEIFSFGGFVWVVLCSFIALPLML